MKNQEYINNLLSRLTAITGAPVLLGHVYVNDDFMLQFLAHGVVSDSNPALSVLQTYLVTYCIDAESYPSFRPYDYRVGFLPAIHV